MAVKGLSYSLNHSAGRLVPVQQLPVTYSRLGLPNKMGHPARRHSRLMQNRKHFALRKTVNILLYVHRRKVAY